MNAEAIGSGELDQFRHGASRHRVLTAAEEVALAKRIERGDLAAKQQMIEHNLRLVIAVARPYRGRAVPFDDLVQEGAIGLVRAVEKFDHRRGLKFSTYAVWWIRRSIINALGDSRPIRIPASAGQQLAAIQRAEADLHRVNPSTASNEAIVERTGLSPKTVAALRTAARVTASLDEPVGEHATPLGDLVADAGTIDAAEVAGDAENARRVRSMLRALPERHRQVLVRRYGLAGDQAQSHDEIAAWLGVGAERSRQIEHEALHRLRELGGGQRSAALAA